MRVENEIEFYNQARVSANTGEIKTWDDVLFPEVIRKREINLILDQIRRKKPKKILDYGCGAGWLSNILSSEGYSVVGIDSSSWLIENANKLNCASAQFIVGDCMSLPFEDDSFDFITGISIFHHLDTEKAFYECKRVACDEATLLLMEPNKLNPIAAIGRKITDVQSKDEDPFYPWYLIKVLTKTGWFVEEIRYLFPYSLGLSYFFRKVLGNKRIPTSICTIIESSERFLEKIPYMNRLGWIIFIVASKRGN